MLTAKELTNQLEKTPRELAEIYVESYLERKLKSAHAEGNSSYSISIKDGVLLGLLSNIRQPDGIIFEELKDLEVQKSTTLEVISVLSEHGYVVEIAEKSVERLISESFFSSEYITEKEKYLLISWDKPQSTKLNKHPDESFATKEEFEKKITEIEKKISVLESKLDYLEKTVVHIEKQYK